jgi:phage N-6-adenine-methyltransferase
MSPDFATKPSTIEKPAWWTSDEWATPPEFVAQLEAEFGAFDLDPCARAETATAPLYYTIEDDGLLQPWEGHCFVNPPYSAPGPWVAKAIAESGRGTVSLLLLPAATDVGWFHELVLPHGNVRFIRGRLRFLGWHGSPIGSPTAGNILVRVPRVPNGRFHL